MVRRDFIQKIAAASGGVAAAQGAATPARKAAPGATVVYMVKGFTCITCAVGLEVVLKGIQGISAAKATYPEGKVTVGYDPKLQSEEKIRAFINKATGFQVSQVVNQGR